MGIEVVQTRPLIQVLLKNESITSLPKQATYMQRQLVKSSIIFNQSFFKFFRNISVPAPVPARWISLILSPSVTVVVNKTEFYFPLKTVLLHPNSAVVSHTCDVLSSSCGSLRSGNGCHYWRLECHATLVACELWPPLEPSNNIDSASLPAVFLQKTPC